MKNKVSKIIISVILMCALVIPVLGGTYTDVKSGVITTLGIDGPDRYN